MADKAAILANLRSKPYGAGAVLYAADIAQELKTTPGAVYKLLDRGGLGVEVLEVGARLAVSVEEWVDFLAGERSSKSKKPKKAAEPATATPDLPKPKYQVNKDIAKAMSLLRGQRDFYAQLEAELERLVLGDAADEKVVEEVAQTPPKKGLAERTDILRVVPGCAKPPFRAF